MPLAPAGGVCDGLGAVCCVGSSTFVGARTASVSVLRTVSYEAWSWYPYMAETRDGDTPAVLRPPPGCSLCGDG
jgi:hypothetical protein